MTSFKKGILFTLFIAFSQILFAQTTTFTKNTYGDGDFYVPYGVTSLTVECWGAGGGGSNGTGNAVGNGGGGGAYAIKTISVIQNSYISYTVGIGTSSNGGPTLFGRTLNGPGIAMLTASGGYSGANGPGAGGTYTAGAGVTGFLGGNGTTGSLGGGGGGSAGTNSNGNSASGNNGGAAVTGGGAGGTAQIASSQLKWGANPGGGGAGGNINQDGGLGADGKIRITYINPSNDANLSNLQFSSGSLSPSFDSTVLNYSTINTLLSSVDVTVTRANANSTVWFRVNSSNDYDYTLISGNTGSLNLAIGINYIDVKVRSQNWNTIKEYRVAVVRGSLNANLSNLTISTGTLSPSFDSTIIAYTSGTTSATTATIGLTRAVAGGGYQIWVNNNIVNNNSATNNSINVSLVNGTNVIDIRVYSQSLVTYKDYKITLIRRQIETDLTSLVIRTYNTLNVAQLNAKLSPTFEQHVTDYTAYEYSNLGQIQIDITKFDASATIVSPGLSQNFNTLTNTSPLTTGNNIFTIEVSKAGYLSKTYTINIIKMPSGASTLNSLNLGSYTVGKGSFSLRKLSTNHLGPAIRVRRGTSLISKDIYFTAAGDLDTATLKSFIGSENGSVTIWYDQSGSRIDALQNDTSKQPLIAINGIITRINSKPTISFNNDFLETYLHSDAYQTAFTFAICGGVRTNTSNASFFSKANNGANSNAFSASPFEVINSTAYLGNGLNTGNSFALTNGLNSSSGFSQWYFTANHAGSSAFRNGVANGTGSAYAFNDNQGSTIIIGSRYNNNAELNGWVSEIVGIASVLNSSDQQLLENLQASYHGINTNSNNYLDGLTLSSGTLSPAFSPTVTNYTASVNGTSNTISVTPINYSSSTTISVNSVQIAAGASSGNINLNLGSNTINIVVTASNLSTRTYTILINYSPEFVFGNIGSVTSPACFGLRKLRPAYTGNAIQVRRSNDNTTADIGFISNGDLDTAALKTFVGANNGFISIWYDQSGNGRNAIQVTNNLQPQIINIGSIYRRNNRPTIYFNGKSLATASYSSYSIAFTLAAIAGVQTNTSASTFGGKTINQIPAPFDVYNSNMLIGNGLSDQQLNVINLTNGINATSGFSNWIFTALSGTSTAFRNGNNNGSGSTPWYANYSSPLYIGTRGDGTTSLNGWISEFLTFGNELNTSYRQTVESDQLNYYNFNNKNLTALSLGNAIISPTFSSNVTSYSAVVTNANTTVSAVSETETSTIAVRINGGTYVNISSGVASSALTLSSGQNTIDVRVTGTDNSSQVYTISTFRPSSSGLDFLGLSQSSPAAFSLRRLSSLYTGNAIQVRRSSDNTTTDIGFTANRDLDTVALKNFVGNNNGFVTIWYDQSGNGRNAIQSTLANQPQIVSSGTVLRKLGLPSIIFNQQSMSTASFTGYPSAYTLGLVFGLQTEPSSPTTFTQKGSSSPWGLSSFYLYMNDGSNFNSHELLNSSIRISRGWHQRIISASSSTIKTYINGTNYTNENSTFPYADLGGSIAIGSNTNFNCWISEFVTYPSVLNTTDRQILENNEINYFKVNNMGLSSLTFSNITLNTPFSPNTFSYTGSSSSSTFTITPNREVAEGSLQIIAGSTYALSNGVTSTFNLSQGVNNITVRVFAAEGAGDYRDYSFTIYRGNRLDNLGLDLGIASPAAYSLRKLSSSYSGNAITVRRSSDNSHLNIGFTANGDLDTTALKNFVGNGNGFVATWRDQAGSFRDLYSGYTTDQPKIVINGVVSRKNGKPAVYFESNSTQTSPDFSDYTNAFSLSIIGGVQSNTSFPSLGYRSTSSSVAGPWDVYGGSFLYGNASSQNSVTLSKGISSENGFSQWSFAASSAGGAAFRNGANNRLSGGGANAYSSDFTSITLGVKNGRNLVGWISEYVTFRELLSTSNRQIVENNQMAYYGLTNSNLSDLSINNATLSPVFNPNTTAYSVNVSGSTVSISASSEISESTIQVRLNNGVSRILVSGASTSFDLISNTNTIEVNVTAPNGTNAKTYTISINSSLANIDRIGLASAISPASFSLRKLSSNYSGNAIRVRRSSDNTTQDIGFTDNGDLDTTTLITFVGANIGFVSIWYDQSGNGRNATQATLAAQPQIVNSGTIFRRNGKPTVYFNNTSLATASYTGYPSAFTLEIVAGIQNNTSYSTFGAKTTTGIAGPWEHWHQYFAYGNNVTQSTMILTNPVTSASGFSQWSFAANASGANAFRNSLTNGSGGSSTYTDAGGALHLGTRGGDGATSLNGWISEYVTLGFVLSLAERQTIERNQTQYYNFSNNLTNTNLSSLSLNNGTLSPSFASSTTSYTTSVTTPTTTLNASAEIAEASMQVRVNNGTFVNLSNGVSSPALALNSGLNTIDVKVTSLDGTNIKTYTIAITSSVRALDNLGLNESNTSTVAFSLRKLNSTYSGSAIQVRRSSDNTLQDIGFTASGNLDTAALKTFVGANNGFVRIWYDQSGNGNNAANGTADAQPSIVTSGIVNRIPGLGQPVLTTTTASQSLNFAVSPSITGSNLTANAVAFMQNGSANHTRLVSFSNGSSSDDWNNNSYVGAIIGNMATNQVRADRDFFATSNSKGLASFASNTPGVITSLFNGTNHQMFVNGAGGTAVASSGSFGITFGRLFNHSNDANPANWIGGAWEIIVFPSALNTTDRQTIENNQGVFYNVYNANLSAINLSNGSVSPSFTANTVAYTASVSNATSSITVTPTVDAAGATLQIRVNGGAYATVSSGAASSALNLNVGSNTIDIRVTALDGSTTKTYTITVTKGQANALNFQQSGNNYVNVPNSASITLGNTYTIETWINYSGQSRTIVDKGTYNYLFQVNAANNDKKLGFYTLNKAAWQYSTGTVPENTWTHVALTFNNGVVTFYINGVASGTGNSVATSSTGALNIGLQAPGNCNCNHFNGGMDEFRIWNVARTESQIQANMNSTLSAQAGLVALYNFNQGIEGGNNSSVTTVTDASGNGNNGTLQNFTLTGATSNWVQRSFLTNTDLSSLAISTGSLSPGFATATTVYTASVSNSTNSITVTPTRSDVSATIQVRVNGGSNSSVTSGVASSDLSLNVGSNTIEVLVTAQDGTTTKTYTIIVTRAPAPPGNALKFDGTNDYVVSAVSGTSVTSFTIESYIKFTTNESKGILQWANGLGAGNPFIYWLQSGLDLSIYMSQNYGITTTLSLNTWYHVALVYSANVYTLYVNGNSVGSYNAGFWFQGNATNFYLGNGYHGYFGGSMDEVRIWNTALTQSQIQSAMNRELAGSENNLMAYYNFNEGIAGGTNSGFTTLTDKTSNANNGTLNNFALTGTNSNWIESYGMVVPTANAATSIAGTSFTANWSAPSIGAVNNYRLDVSTSSTFVSFVSGYNALSVSGTSHSVTGLSAGATYYYRVRAEKTSVTGQGGYSSTITATTLANTLNNVGLSASTPAASAYSLRKLSSTYTGNAIQVRRSSDNTTIDIGFAVNGDLDTTTLKTFVGANNGFVTIWYDQSGNSRNAIQATLAAQPQIVSSGNVFIRNGKPTIYFNSTSLATASYTSYSSGYTLAIVAGVQTNTTYPTFGSKYDANFYGPWEFWGQYFANGNQNTQTSYILTYPISSASGFSQWSFSASSAGGQAFRNGAANGSAGASNYADGPNALYIGTRGGDGATTLNGWISEYVTFGSVLNTTDRQTTESNQFQYYNFNNANLSACNISNGTLSPSFAANTTTYTASVANATSSITVTPIVEITGATVQVRVNGGSYSMVASGAASGSLSLNVGGNTIDVRVTAIDGVTLKTYTITTTRNSLPTWTGATSNVWNLASNWSPAEIPASNANVVIGSSNNNPVLGANTIVNDLTLNDTLVIGNNTLTINGAVSGSNVLKGAFNSNLTITGASGTIRFDQSTPGTTNVLRNLSISGSGTTVLGNTINISGGASAGLLTVGSGATLNTGGNLRLRSEVNGTAAIGNSTGTISGNVTVERFIPRRRAFRFLSSPVNTSNFISNNWQQATHITGSLTGQNGFDQSNSGTASLFTYNAGTEAWTAIPNTNATNLNIGTGYRMLIRGDRNINLNSTSPQDSAMLVLSATGTVVTGNVVFGGGSVSSSPVSVPRLNSSIGSGANNSTVGWSLIGNPYASAVNWTEVSKSNVSNTFATWNVNNAGRGSYVYHNGNAGTGFGASNIINSGQSVFVQTIGANPSLIFTEASKVSSAPPSHFKKSISDVLNIDIFIGDRAYDGLAVMFDENCNNQYDVQDFIKLVNPEINFYSYLADGTKLAMNNMKEIGTETIVPLGLNGVFNGSSYEMKFSNQNSFASADVKLKDKFINKTYDLKSINNLTFTVTSDSNSFGENRFELIFSKTANGLNNEMTSNNNFIVFPNPASGVLNVSLTTSREDNYSYTIFNQLGAEVSNGHLDFNTKRTHALNIENLSAGVYFIQVKNGKTAQTIKFIK